MGLLCGFVVWCLGGVDWVGRCWWGDCDMESMARKPMQRDICGKRQPNRNRGVAARFPLSVSSFAGSISGARKLVKSAATWSSLRRSTEASLGASTGVSGGVFTDGVSLHPVRIMRLRNSSSVRMVEAFREVTLKR